MKKQAKFPLLLLLLAFSASSVFAGGPDVQVTVADLGGTVGIANGGTGQTASSAALGALGGLSNTTTVAIASGGTGAVTAATALAALGGFASAGGVISGFTSLGSGNTAIKVKILSGTTSGSTGGNTAIAHGLTGDKIIAIQAIVHQSPNQGIPPEWSGGADYLFRMSYTSTDVNITNGAAAGFILTKTITVIIFYVE